MLVPLTPDSRVFADGSISGAGNVTEDFKIVTDVQGSGSLVSATFILSYNSAVVVNLL